MGRSYRSLLEAKWASFFDILRWDVEYEPFEFDGWIPDFRIAGKDTVAFVEIKPVNEFPDSVALKIRRAVHENPIFDYDEAAVRYPPAELLILGDSPIFERWGSDHEESAFLGWFADERCRAPFGIWRGSESVEKNPTKKVGFCHEIQSFADRITGCYDGGSYGSDIPPIRQMWAAACNRVQWKR
jgi:hypothetical protein